MGIDVGDPAAVEADVQATVAALTDRLRSVTAADVAGRLGARLVDSNRPAPVGPLAPGRGAGPAGRRLGARRPQAPAARRHDADGDAVVVRLPDRTLRLPAATGKAVRALLDGERLRVGDLPDLDAEDALVAGPPAGPRGRRRGRGAVTGSPDEPSRRCRRPAAR